MHRSLFFGMILFLFCISLTSCTTSATPTLAPTTASTFTPIPLPTPTSTPVPLPTRTSTPNSDELRSKILAVLSALNEKSYRQQSDTLLNNGTSYHTVVEFVAPDRYHIVANAATEFIVVSQKVYIKQNSGWAISDIPVANIVDSGFINRLKTSISDILFVNLDSLNGKPMQVYSYKSKAKIGDTETIQQSQLWIGATDNLPYKLIIEGEVASLDGAGKVVGVKSTSTILYEYDPTIKIVSPIP